ncbi:MAG: exodeoxyribonuclease VII small subunit [Firmicutes bacterium]|nr:exodeoxyribonuclease VII small subunit [Bacillota bacterium]
MKKEQSTNIDNSKVLQDNINQLKQIVDSLQQQDINIEDGIKSFGVGLQLASQSLEILNNYKGQLKELKIQADELIESDFIL